MANEDAGGPRPRLEVPLVDRNTLLEALVQVTIAKAWLDAVLAGHGEQIRFLQNAALNAEAASDTLERYR
jgi:hypothetical protein